MDEAVQPQSGDWNNYWSLDQTKKFTNISWSKRRIIKVLENYLKTDGFALDAGCGSGFFSQYFCNSGMSTYSLDYSDAALKIAQEKTNGRANLVKSDLLNDRLSEQVNARFDLIFTDGLFEHFTLEQQNTIFTNLKSVLSRDGVIVTFVPNKYSPWELIRPFYMPGIKEDPFVLKQLVALNETNDMQSLRRGGLNTFPFRLSPDKWFGAWFGMLLYTVSKINRKE